MQFYFTVDSSAIIFERFDDEVIAINLNRGTYYSLNPTAATIFELAAKQPTLEEVVAELSGRYDGCADDMESHIVRFMTELESEGLIGRSHTRSETAPPILPPLSEKVAFLAPAFTVHRDMQDLFLLDPVHEVGEAGWPEKQNARQADSDL